MLCLILLPRPSSLHSGRTQPCSSWRGKLLGQLLADSWATSWPLVFSWWDQGVPGPNFRNQPKLLKVCFWADPVLRLRCAPPLCVSPFCGQMTAAQQPSSYKNLNKILFTVLGAYERVTVLFLKQTVSTAEMPAVSTWACHLSFQALCDVSRKKKKKNFTRLLFFSPHVCTSIFLHTRICVCALSMQHRKDIHFGRKAEYP